MFTIDSTLFERDVDAFASNIISRGHVNESYINHYFSVISFIKHY